MRAPRGYTRPTTNVARTARDLVGRDVLDGTLDGIVDQAVRLVDGCDAAGVITIQHGTIETVACAGPVTRIAERLPAAGPWVDLAAGRERMYRIEDTYSTTQSWHTFAERARTLGIGSMMGFLLHTDGQHSVSGLELYAGSRGAFVDGCEQVGWVLASHAAVALARARHTGSLDAALTSAHAIGRAVGIVRGRYELSNEAAFAAISQSSRERNIKIRDLAEEIGASGDLPRGSVRSGVEPRSVRQPPAALPHDPLA